MSATEFEETTPAPRWLRVIGACVLAIAAALALVALLAPNSVTGCVAGLAIGIVVCALVGLLLTSMRMRLRVTDDALTLALEPIIRNRIPLASITAATVEDLRPSQVGGIGYRIAGHDRAFLFSGGPAVAITVRASTRRYLWRTDDAERVLTQISSKNSIK